MYSGFPLPKLVRTSDQVLVTNRGNLSANIWVKRRYNSTKVSYARGHGPDVFCFVIAQIIYDFISEKQDYSG